MRKVEEKTTELATKLNKQSERLAAGKLPAKWHMLRESKGILTKSVPNWMNCKLGSAGLSHIQHLIDHKPGCDDEMGDEEDSDILDVGSNLSLGEDSGDSLGLVILFLVVLASNFIPVVRTCNLFLLQSVHRGFAASAYYAHSN